MNEEILNLIKKNSFALNKKRKSRILKKLLLEEYKYQIKNNNFFLNITKQYNPKLIKVINDFPFIPVQYFKTNFQNLKTTKDKSKVISSSATSGKPSNISIDAETSRRQIYSVFSTLQNFVGNKRFPFVVCDFDHSHNFLEKKLSARSAASNGFLNFSNKKYYIFENSKNFNPNLDELIKFVSENKEGIILFGFTFLIYEKLIKLLKEKKKKINFPKNSYIIHIGGWKALEDKKISSKEFKKLSNKYFGINKNNIIDIYGFTEQIGTLYPECQYGYKHVPDFADVICRNPFTYEILPKNKSGVGQFLSIVPHSYPGFSVLTDDIIKIVGEDDCKCGRKGKYFKILGRSKYAEVRGCGDVIANSTYKIDYKKNKKNNNNDKLIFFNNNFQNNKSNFSLTKISQTMKKNQKILNTYQVDEIIMILKEASKIWANNTKIKKFKLYGLDFVCSWLSSDNFEKLLDFSLKGSRGLLDNFKKREELNKSIIGLPRGIVGHWLAGNSPVLGILSILSSIICKNTNIIKVPKKNSQMLEMMIQLLKDIRVRYNQKLLKGSDLTKNICLLYCEKNSENNSNLSEVCDARIAWGGKEAVENILKLPKKYYCEDIIFGPKLSLGVITKRGFFSQKKISRLAKNIALDVFVFDQQACSSIHNLFVEKIDKKNKEIFLNELQTKFQDLSKQFKIETDSYDVFDNIKSKRLEYVTSSKDSEKAFFPKNLEWTILTDENLELSKPVFGRTLFVHFVDDINKIQKLITKQNQVVAINADLQERDKIAKNFLEKGVSRVTNFGQTSIFDYPWDDLFPTDRLVRWCLKD